MNTLHILSVPQPLCLFPTDYSIAFMHHDRLQYTLSFEERIISMQVLKFPWKEMRITGVVYNPEIIFVIDEYLNWGMFALAKNSDKQQKPREVLSSKEINLFEYLGEVSNKDRKNLNCFVNLINRSNKCLIEFQINTHRQHLTMIEIKNTETDTIFSHFCKDITQTLAYQHLFKELIIVKCFSVAPILESSPLVNPQEFYSKYIVVKESDSDGKGRYSLFQAMVKSEGTENYQMLVGKTMFCDFGEEVRDIFYTEIKNDKPKSIKGQQKDQNKGKGILVICLSTSIMLHELKTKVSINFPFTYKMIWQKSESSFELIDQNTYRLVELNIQEGPMLKTRQILKDIQGYIQLSQVSKNSWYMLSEQKSVFYGQFKTLGLQTKLVLQNLAAKILSVSNRKDKFSNTLAIEKSVGSIVKTQYLSNQPHLTTLLKLSHTLPCELIEVIPITSSTLLLTNPLIGSLFLDITLSSSQLTAKNSPEFKAFETKERTLMLKKVGQSTIQVTESKIILREPSLIKTIESRDLFDNMQVSYDHAFYVNRTIGLVIRGQIHLYAVRSQCRLESRFIYVFDQQIQYVASLNDYQLIMLKFYQQNTIKIFQVDFEKQTLNSIMEINKDFEVKICKSFAFPVQINGVAFSIAIVTIVDQYPLIIFSPNQIKKKPKDIELTMFEFKALSPDYFDNLIQVASCFDIQKYFFLAKNIYLRFQRTYNFDGLLGNFPIFCQKTLNQTYDPSSVLAVTLLTPNTNITLTREWILLQQESLGKFSLPRELLSIEGFMVMITIEKQNNDSILTISAYEKCQTTNDLADENFNKANQLEIFTSSILLQEDNKPPNQFPKSIARFTLPSMPVTNIRQLKGPLLLVQTTQQLLLCRVILRDRKLHLVLYSRFSYDNQSFSLFQNKLPLSDLDDPAFMAEFSRKHPIKQLSSLDTTHSFTQSRNYFIVLYSKFLIVLEIDCLVFKIHQVLAFQGGLTGDGKQEHLEQVDSVLDNFKPESAYLRGSNHLFILEKNTKTDKYYIKKEQPLDDAIVFASNIDNWAEKARFVKVADSEPVKESQSKVIVKEFGQLEATTKDRKGKQACTQVYL